MVVGYPSKVNSGFNGYEMVASSASGGYLHEKLFGYQASTLAGMSGGPVLVTNTSPSPSCAVHTNTKDLWEGPRPKRSSGFLLNDNTLNWIDQKISEVTDYANV